MIKKFLILFLLPIALNAQPPSGYYDSTTGLSGWALKTQLSKIISNKNVNWHYRDLPDWFESTDRDLWYENDSTILDIYSEIPLGVDSYNYTYEDSSLISGASEEGLGWNREHIFSQSFFYSDYPMYSDLHFIVPTDARVNQRRSNLPFANVGISTTFISKNGSKVGLSATPGYTLTVFEPIDSFKGDIARMLFYVAIRYESLLPFFQHENSRNPYDAQQEKAFRSWLLPLFKSWHELDPVSPREIHRNNVVFDIQGNRNPIIDHPEWVNTIWFSGIPDSTAPSPPIYIHETQKGKSFLSVSWYTDPEPDIIGFQVFLNDTFIAVSKKSEFVFTDLMPGTVYKISVRAYDSYFNLSDPATPLFATTSSTDTFSQDLFFSKYIEGSNDNKALEITNLTGHEVDLRHYKISIRQINDLTGALYWSSNSYKLEGFLPHNRKIVIAHPNFNLDCIPSENIDFLSASTPIAFEGNLAIELSKNDKRIDIILDPDASDTIAHNTTLYRSDTIKDGTLSWAPLTWITHPLDYCVGLGNQDSGSSVQNQTLKNTLQLYPNPNSDGKLFFEGDRLKEINLISLHDITGRAIKQYTKPFFSSHYITLPHLPNGIYFLIINNEAYKLMIQK